MQRVGNQRQAAGQNAADHLHDRQPEIDEDGEQHPPVTGIGIYVVMMVAVAMAVTMVAVLVRQCDPRFCALSIRSAPAGGHGIGFQLNQARIIALDQSCDGSFGSLPSRVMRMGSLPLRICRSRCGKGISMLLAVSAVSIAQL